MLPGFRFLFAAIVLSMSVLVFGLGAAALLRAAHEEFASTPAWRVAPEPKFARRDEAPAEAPMPVLAMLRVEPEPAQPAAADGISAAAPTEPAAIAPMPDQPDKIAALEPQDKTQPEAAKPDIAAPETSVQGEAPASDIPAPAPAEETRIAAAEQALPPAIATVAPAPEQAIMPPPAPDTDLIALKIATLGGPPVAIEAPPPAKARAKPDASVAKKRQQARRAKERRRIALRARQAATQQQAADPFSQPTITTRAR